MPQPGNPQALNRYAYVYNNPMSYTDPTGHIGDPDRDYGGSGKYNYYHLFSQPTFVPWWDDVDPPSIRTITAGGNYGYGQITYGGHVISVYRPPTVWYPGANGCYATHDPLDQELHWRSSTSFAGDYAYGDACTRCGGRTGDFVKANTWGTVGTKIRTELPSLDEALVGVYQGLGAMPEDLPPGPDALPAELILGNALPMGFAATAGALAAGRESAFILQSDYAGGFRLVVVSRQLQSMRSAYATSQGFIPVTWGGPTITRR